MAVTRRKVITFVLGFLLLPLLALACVFGQAFFEHFEGVWTVVAFLLRWGLVIAACSIFGFIWMVFLGETD